MASTAHRIAVVGLGIMGRRMLANINRHPDFEAAGLWDPSDASCQKTLDEAPESNMARSAQAAIESADAVYFACPPGPRKALALAAAKQGKAVFLEKPLGIDVDESRDLVRELDQSGVACAVNFTQAGGRALAEVVRAQKSGETGAMVGVDIVVTYPAWPRAWQVEADWLRFRAEGGYTREVVSHFMFLTERLIGETWLIRGHAYYPDDDALCETHVMARLENVDGVPVTIMGSVGGVQPDRQEVTVTGERCSYRISEFFHLTRSDGGAFEDAIEMSDDPRLEALQRQLDEFDKCLRGEPHLLATPREALSVQRKIEAILSA